MARLSWYARRLRTMSPAEIGWRVTSQIATRVRAHRAVPGLHAHAVAASLADFRAARHRPVFLDRGRAHEIAAAHPQLVEYVLAAADDACELRFQYFGYPGVQLNRPIDWNHDPVSGVHWPVAPAAGIDHRTADGDPKWIWELNRLQHLPLLAQAWLFTGDEKYTRALFDQLDSWMTANPPGVGIAWRGAFEAGVRAVSVAIAVAGVRDSELLTAERYAAIVELLAESATRCERERSRFSSANNHLIGELVGLATVATLFPDLPDAPHWERVARAELVGQADRQIHPDGVGAEQAVGYQIFTAELFAVAIALWGDRDGVAPPELTDAVLRGAQFLAQVGDPQPRFGDDDEGFALRLGAEPLRSVAEHLDLVAGLRGAPADDPTVVSAARAWFAATRLAPLSLRRPSSAQVHGESAYFADGGVVVLRSAGRRVTVDVGPLGFLAIAAHGHADALGVTVALDGHEVIGDPGTGSYYGHPQWRTVMRGTQAHATVTVDGSDQSEMAGAFLWTRHARTRVRAVDLERGVVDAEHDGYAVGRAPVVHRRWVVAPPPGSELSSWVPLDAVLVVDLLSGTGRHDLKLTWPLPPEVDIRRTASDETVLRIHDRDIARIATFATQPMAEFATRGDEASGHGFWSDRLESRTPSWWMGMSGQQCALPTVIATLVTRDPISETSDVEIGFRVEAHHHGGDIVVTLSRGGVQQRGVIDTRREGQVRVAGPPT
ncbi:alginate lyase family protein [Williamsia sp. CHRR-6]|uniref:alginate lyase family protein n=1 Tax=Williamsia sp. CHRR-6 TaxID=2835871 RepID=UPI001BDA9418|nr:alginate lyase family protein [Williamsia sp. CHRR-6]MBT0566279.1 alginate lyase family protein [Williamsia sp. CHRR-6]